MSSVPCLGRLRRFTPRMLNKMCNMKKYSRRKYFSDWVTLKGRDFVTLHQFTSTDIEKLLWTALDLKHRHVQLEQTGQRDEEFLNLLRGKSLTMVTDVPSMRTKASVAHAMSLLGGSVQTLTYDDIGQVEIGTGLMVVTEEYEDGYRDIEIEEDVNNENGRSLGYISSVVATRTGQHGFIERLAVESPVPVINMSSDLFHPIKALSYLLTWLEHFGFLSRLNVTWIGQGCNLLNSLMFACSLAGADLTICTPVGYEPDPEMVVQAFRTNASSKAVLNIVHEMTESVYKSEVLICGAWNNVPDRDEKEQRQKDFKDYQITSKIFKEKSPENKVMHQLPWSEIEMLKKLMFGGDTLTWKELENRKYAAMAVLVNILGDYQPSAVPEPRFKRLLR